MAITVRANESQLADIEKLKKCLDVNTSAGALLRAAKEHPALAERYRESLEANRKLQHELNQIKRAVGNYRDYQESLFKLVD
ncbi:hypothetical protein [Shewanella psychrotolerans]|uniref:hypothetical protein n=1 Tax=Shewanella psychrotolerans TaxID=2864206 RepID=UPI001C65FF92|nr:hypothetical protein [Shewanella psychrotolerans]QYK03121.1 hypothetical protein K0I62_09475 [Shewanella psychrotolerans]